MAIQINKIAMSLALMATAGSATAAAKPNILAIMGDDIGYWNISAALFPKSTIKPHQPQVTATHGAF
ncbi:hypothetical protein ACEUEC_12255 [Aeromonas veronii]|uniref:hypothetical protein n=1 Tax=Aeromonas veronii TaxID=654 RepID=UPI002B47B440|nr:hypothetical protein [Aeromonas veronii]